MIESVIAQHQVRVLDRTQATVLFDTLDRELKLFRRREMTEDDWKYWAITRERFIQIYSEDIPYNFWLDTLEIGSATLRYQPEQKFYITCPALEEHHTVLTHCNKAVKNLELRTSILDNSHLG